MKKTEIPDQRPYNTKRTETFDAREVRDHGDRYQRDDQRQHMADQVEDDETRGKRMARRML